MNLLKLAKRTRIILGGAFALVLIGIACPTPASLLAGLPVVILGESIRTWSSGHIRKNKALATDGPYAHTRNPLYLGSFLIGLGFVVMSRSLWGLAIYLAAYALIYRAVIRYEENDLAKAFGGGFAEYVRTVPRFIPRISRAPYRAGGFDWALVFKHREYQAWLGIAGGLAALLVKLGMNG